MSFFVSEKAMGLGSGNHLPPPITVHPFDKPWQRVFERRLSTELSSAVGGASPTFGKELLRWGGKHAVVTGKKCKHFCPTVPICAFLQCYVHI